MSDHQLHRRLRLIEAQLGDVAQHRDANRRRRIMDAVDDVRRVDAEYDTAWRTYVRCRLELARERDEADLPDLHGDDLQRLLLADDEAGPALRTILERSPEIIAGAAA